MKRNLKKAIEEYQKTFLDSSSPASKFYASDIQQIYDMTTGNTENERLYNAICNALNAGFIIGYQKGQNNR